MSNQTRKDIKSTGGGRNAGSPNASGPDTATTTKGRPKVPPRLQDTFIDERNDVLGVINELEDQLDRYQEVREQLERELTSTGEQLQAANQKTHELEWQVVTLQTRVDALEQLKHEVAALEEEVTDANSRAQRINEQFLAADKERGRLKQELKAANKQVDELWPIRKERDGLRTDCKNLGVKVDELERLQRELIEERGGLQTQIQDLQINLEETRNEKNKLEATVREQHDRIRELSQIQEIAADKIEQLRVEKKNLQVQISHLERENSRLIEQRQFYESEVTTLRNQSKTAETALASVKKAFTEVRVALSETKSRARRRSLEPWPRIGTALRGLAEQADGDEMVGAIAGEDHEPIPGIEPTEDEDGQS